MASELLLSLRLGALLAEPVPREVADALLSVQVTEGVGRPGGFQLSFATGKRSVLFQELLPGVRWTRPPGPRSCSPSAAVRPC